MKQYPKNNRSGLHDSRFADKENVFPSRIRGRTNRFLPTQMAPNDSFVQKMPMATTSPHCGATLETDKSGEGKRMDFPESVRKFVAARVTEEAVGVPLSELVFRALSRHEAVKEIVGLQKKRKKLRQA